MRMPINRGIPAPINGGFFLDTAGHFKPGGFLTVNEPDAILVYRVTAYARNVSTNDVDIGRDVTNIDSVLVTPNVTLAEVHIAADDFSQVKLFDEFPIRQSGGVTLSAGVGSNVEDIRFYGFIDIDADNAALVSYPLRSGRIQEPFTLPIFQPQLGDAEILIHELVPGVVDLVNIELSLPVGMALELRFYDGSKVSGVPGYFTMPLVNSFSDPVNETLFSQHPMMGPGSIRAIVTAADAPSDKGLIYGSVQR